MRIISSVTSTLFVSLSMAASAQPDPVGVFWNKHGVSLVRTACAPGDIDNRYCRAIELVVRANRQILGTGYMHVKLLWRGRGSSSAPDVLVFGDDGGSGGSGDLIAVTLGPKPIVTKYNSERLDQVRASSSATVLRLELPFQIGYFNGAPHSGVTIAPIPTVWANGDFRADFKALMRPTISAQELRFRELAMREELQAWRDDHFGTSRLYPPEARSGTPVTLQTLTDLTVTGHADEAKALLDRAWPTSFGRTDVKVGGEGDFWKSYCRAILRNPLWRKLGLQRLPQTGVIEEGAS
jgi:hypothetical protein